MRQLKNHPIKLAAIIFFIFQIIGWTAILGYPSSVSAQSKPDSAESLQFTPQVTIPDSDFTRGASTNVGAYNSATGKIDSTLFAKYIGAIYNYGLAIAGILATIMLMIAGVIWLTSGGDSGKVAQAKELISGSIVGLIILVASWLILNTINPDLVNLKAIQTTNLESASIPNCCDPSAGRVFADKNGACVSPAVSCPSGTNCKNTHVTGIGSGADSFSCVGENKNYNCCEYSPTHPEYGPIYCQTESAGQICSYNRKYTDKYGKKINGTLTSNYQNLYCGNGVAVYEYDNCKEYGKLLETDLCKNRDDGDLCVGDRGFCYNGLCLTEEYGKENQPCGNEKNSICVPSKKCANQDVVGGRDCVSGLWCCEGDAVIK